MPRPPGGGLAGYEYLLGRARRNLAQAPASRKDWVARFLAELGKDAPRMP